MRLPCHLTFFILLQREKFICANRYPFKRNLQGTPAGGAIGAVVTTRVGGSPEGFVVFVAGVGCRGVDAATEKQSHLSAARQ